MLVYGRGMDPQIGAEHLPTIQRLQVQLQVHSTKAGGEIRKLHTDDLDVDKSSCNAH